MTFLWFLVGLTLGSLLVRFVYSQKLGTLSQLSEKLIQQAEAKAKNLFANREATLLAERAELHKEQERLKVDSKKINELEKRVKTESTALLKQEKELQRIAQMTKEEARALLIEEERKGLEKQTSIRLQQAKDAHEEEATRILLTALTRLSGTQIPESGQTIFTLTSSDQKSKIVGKEGRNLRAFEELTGATLLIDELPDSIIISCFDPERRLIAERALKTLIEDGRISPERIQEAVHKTKALLPDEFFKLGQNAAKSADVSDLAPEVLATLGKLHIRTSFTQNVLAHSVEVSHLMNLMAAELKLNSRLARRIGLLHDIGKALPAEEGLSHALVGAHFVKLHGEKEDVTNGIASHHEEVAPRSFEAALCKVADTLSAARRGARPQLQSSRLQELESIAHSFPGVQEAFALYAGRELRVIVKPEEVTDQQAELLLHALSLKINSESPLASKVKITLIRENKLVKI